MEMDYEASEESSFFCLPEELSCRLNETLKDDDIIKMSVAYQNCISYPWEVFAELHLKISHGDVENIAADQGGRLLQIQEMFRRWKESHPDGKTPNDLIEILDNARLVGIKQHWFSEYTPNKTALGNFNCYRITEFEKNAGLNFNPEQFTKFLCKLGVQDKEDFVKDRSPNNILKQRLDILHIWENRVGFMEATLEKLNQCIEQVLVPNGRGEPFRQLSNKECADRQPFMVRRTAGSKISVCQGCRQKFDHMHDRLVVAHWEEVTYKNHEGIVVNEWTNGHYHLSLDCIRVKWQNFQGKVNAVKGVLCLKDLKFLRNKGFELEEVYG
uniref:uncharacterized protein LOC100183014 isoform X2 n=1 Tax=Ciona intestinalis TaxID=7719 RepID=UPI000180CE41|nr:uncharacterized protein LOC100183014 isoform X2 [Ciona intestinalis]|eukprot:XP_002132106.1 uncharacterized protein LOC100183014 isoform X2 [Ciona intestinalis]